MENNLPLVSVNILSYNRKDELRNTLQKVYEQDYKNIEVIVVDNASDDGSAEMVKAEFPSVILIKMEKNIGIAGWNEGFKIAKGEYVLVLDDDSYPDIKTIESGINKMILNPNIAIVALNVIDVKRNMTQTGYFTKPYKDFIGCGAIIRNTAFTSVGGFDQVIFIYAHELDFSIRILNAGFEIDYIVDSKVFHRSKNLSNIHPINNSFRFYYQTISFIIVLKKYLDNNMYIKAILKLVMNRLIIALYFKKMKELFKIIKFIIGNQNNSIEKVNIRKEVLSVYNFQVAFFDRTYFGGLIKQNPKVIIPVLYLFSILLPMERKNTYII
jgi:GT2 family glycosyltransferase